MTTWQQFRILSAVGQGVLEPAVLSLRVRAWQQHLLHPSRSLSDLDHRLQVLSAVRQVVGVIVIVVIVVIIVIVVVIAVKADRFQRLHQRKNSMVHKLMISDKLGMGIESSYWDTIRISSNNTIRISNSNTKYKVS